jgi:glucose-6-phosphate 1-dehydrogenase
LIERLVIFGATGDLTARYLLPGVVALHEDNVIDRMILGLSQKEIVDNVITALTSNGMIAPNYWIDPQSGNPYMLTVQYPEDAVKTVTDLKQIPLRGVKSAQPTLSPLSEPPQKRYLALLQDPDWRVALREASARPGRSMRNRLRQWRDFVTVGARAAPRFLHFWRQRARIARSNGRLPR